MSDDDSADELERRLHAQREAGALAEGVTAGVERGLLEVVKRTPALAATALGGPLAGLATAATIEAAHEVIRRLGERSVVDAMHGLADRAPEIEQKHAALVKAGYGSAADVRAIVQAYLAAWTAQSDARVRELIENAAVNGFDPRKYEQGVTRRIIRILGELEYGDVHQLREVEREWKTNSGGGGATPWHEPGSMTAQHATRLVEHGLVWKFLRTERQGSFGPDVNTIEHARPTELGQRLLEHIKREAEAQASRGVDEAVARGTHGSGKR